MGELRSTGIKFMGCTIYLDIGEATPWRRSLVVQRFQRFAQRIMRR